jgi:hypothetical protein
LNFEVLPITNNSEEQNLSLGFPSKIPMQPFVAKTCVNQWIGVEEYYSNVPPDIESSKYAVSEVHKNEIFL